MRRNIKSDVDPLTKSQILKLLFPGYSTFVAEVMEKRELEIKEEYKAPGASEDPGDAMLPYRDQALIFRAMDTAATDAEESKLEESKGEEEKVSVKAQEG